MLTLIISGIAVLGGGTFWYIKKKKPVPAPIPPKNDQLGDKLPLTLD